MSMRFTWPWGRLSPGKRLEELDRLISKHRSIIRIIEAQAREAIRLQERSIEALMQQRRIVETFLDEDKRRAILQRAYDLEALGVPVLERISAAETLDEIEGILDQASCGTCGTSSLDQASCGISSKDLQKSSGEPNILDQDVADLFGMDITDGLFEKGEDT